MANKAINANLIVDGNLRMPYRLQNGEYTFESETTLDDRGLILPHKNEAYRIYYIEQIMYNQQESYKVPGMGTGGNFFTAFLVFDPFGQATIPSSSAAKTAKPRVICKYGGFQGVGFNLDVVVCNARDNRLSTFTVAESDREAFVEWIKANNIASEADTDFLQFQVGDALAKLASTSALKTEAWSLQAANPECDSVVLQLTEDIGIFQAMKEQGIDFLRSRNIYIDMEKIAGLGGVSDIFAGFEALPIGVRYHLFFGNTQTPTKLNWDGKSIESNVEPSVYLDKSYPSAKCEFMRATDGWIYADWEAKTLSLAPTIDSGLNNETDTTALTDYMNNNKLTYEKTANGIRADVASLLASIVSKLK